MAGVWRALLPLLLLAGSIQAQNPAAEAPAPLPGTDSTGRLPRVIILRTNSQGQVFSGTFRGRDTTRGNTTTDTPPSLQIESRVPTSNLEIYSVNVSALNLGSIETFSSDFGDDQSREEARIAAFCRQLLIENPDLKICEPDRLAQLEAPARRPNDPLDPQQWALPAISMAGAWNAGAFGNKGVRVCMVDTGLDYFHPDLAANLWTNPAEIPNNGIDDDNNGIVDDVHGVSFVEGGTSGDPYDDNGHGTFVAGVVGAVGNNGVGTTGISQAVSVIGCKFMGAGGGGWISDAIRCYDYCTRQDAHIISNSWGVYSTSSALEAAAQALNAHGILVTASAGNNAKDTDTNPHPPSTLSTPNIIAVAATQQNGAYWPGTNYGVQTVDVAAPGANVLGLAIGGAYITMTGTSMATPHVTGLAAIILARFLERGYPITTRFPSVGLAAQVKNIIIASSTRMPGPKIILYGGLNASDAVSRVPSWVRAPRLPNSSGTTVIRAPVSPPPPKAVPMSGTRTEVKKKRRPPPPKRRPPPPSQQRAASRTENGNTLAPVEAPAAAPGPSLGEGLGAEGEAVPGGNCVCTCDAPAPEPDTATEAAAASAGGEQLIRSIAPDGSVVVEPAPTRQFPARKLLAAQDGPRR